jgi:Raf kinase inhibitor-like YbhB/YbcL family protein
MRDKSRHALWTLAAIFAALGAAAAADKPGQMEIKSPAFRNGGEIPRKHTCDGGDASPRLTWTEAPPGSQTFALIADDADAPGGTWVHWVIYDLPATTKELPEGIAAGETLDTGAKQGVNDFRKTGYGGPCPPPGAAHRYYFRLYALDAATNLKPRATKKQVLDAIKGHVVAEAELMGKYGR